MLLKLSETIIRISTGRVARSALLVFMVFTAVALPWQSAQSEEYAGQAGSPDLSLFYSPDDLYQMAEAYGPEGRSTYIRARFTFDLIWPLVYMVFLVTSMGWFSGKLYDEASRVRMIPLLPLAGGLFDYLENIATSVVMVRYPDTTILAASLAPYLTLFKWVFISISFVMMLVLILKYILDRIQRGKE
jgi:hypothetical protein